MLRLLILLLLCHFSKGSILVNSSRGATEADLLEYVQQSEKEDKISEKNQRRVYLEDVVYTLKSQKWPEEELPCLNHTLALLTNLQNFTLWAAIIWDATLSEPLGFLSGSPYQFSNYDECLRPGWSQKGPSPLSTQYCLADVRLIHSQPGRRSTIARDQLLPYDSVLDKIKWDGDVTHERGDELTWGVCVPASCSPEAVKSLVMALILRSNLAVTGLSYEITVDSTACQTDRTEEKLTKGSVAFISTCSVLIVIALSCSIYHWYCETLNLDRKPSKWLLSFSLMSNFSDLSSMSDEATKPLYGIRFLSICFIVASHRVGMFLGGPILNGEETEKVYTMKSSIFLSHSDLVVDSFFLLSGCLTSYGLVSHGKPINLLLMLVRRYLRLAPALGMTLFFMATLFWSSGDGPLWRRIIGVEVGSCQKNSWTNMLMISNYVNTRDFCLLISWYVPADFHLFIASTLLYCIYVRRKKFGIVAAAILFLAAILVPGIMVYSNRFPGLLLFLKEFTKKPRASDDFHNIYISTHMRAASYFVGTALGYVFASSYPIKMTNKLSMMKSCLFTSLGLLAMFASIFSGTVFYSGDKQYVAEEAAFYAALDRPLWAAGLALLILATIYGHVPLMSAVLRWSPWVPLSKLSYGIYLVHSLPIMRDVASSRLPRHFDRFSLFTSSLSDIAFAGFVSLALYLFVEAPIQNLFKICITPNSNKRERQSRSDAGASTAEDPPAAERYSSIATIPAILIDKHKF